VFQPISDIRITFSLSLIWPTHDQRNDVPVNVLQIPIYIGKAFERWQELQSDNQVAWTFMFAKPIQGMGWDEEEGGRV